MASYRAGNRPSVIIHLAESGQVLRPFPKEHTLIGGSKFVQGLSGTRNLLFRLILPMFLMEHARADGPINGACDSGDCNRQRECDLGGRRSEPMIRFEREKAQITAQSAFTFVC